MATRADRAQQRRNADLLLETIREHGGTLRAQGLKHTGSGCEVDDILQRAYELFIERFDPRYPALPWLQTTIKREAWGQAKRAHRRFEVPIDTKSGAGEGYDLGECLPDPARGPSESSADRDTAARLAGAVRELKPDERTALGLFALGYSYEEIGELRQWSQTKVNRCIAEGRERARDRVCE